MNRPNELLKAARNRHGWTQADVAEKIDCSTLNISRWENGMTFPSRHYRDRLCKLFNASLRELGLVVEGEDDPDMGLSNAIFRFNEPLASPEELYGRRREKKTLLERTFRKASTSITGPRRIGKTWLVHYLRLMAPERLGSRFRIGYIDAMSPSCRTVAGFTAEALKALDIPAGAPVYDLHNLGEGLESLKEQKLVPVLCIDEFECFADREEFTVDFFGGLRSLTQTLDLVLVVVSKNPLYQVVGTNARGSGFFNIFERVALKAFTMTEAEEFIRDKSNRAGFRLQESDYLWRYGRENEQEQAWLPLRLQLAGKILLDDLEIARRDPHYRSRFEELFKTQYGE